MPSYNTVWRWHFYAGLFCVPFVLWLSLTGAVYLFRPQVEAWIDRPYAHVTTALAPRATAAQIAAAAVQATPGSVLHRYQIPDTRTQAVQVIVGRPDGAETRVYVHPRTLAVLKAVGEQERLMQVVFRLHGELYAGAWGSYLVELAASWAIVMLLTGLFLWWPRGGGPAGVVYPRLRAGGRRFWRDLHGVTGFWVSAMAMFLLVSGLPWATSWGAYLKTVRAVAEGSPAKQDWSTDHGAGTRAMQSEHAEHGGMSMPHPRVDYAPIDRIAATLGPLRLAAPVLIAPPTGSGQPWTAKSDAADLPLRADLTLDAATGAVLTRTDFAQRRLVDRLVGWGIAIHEGQAYGWLNQLVNLATALGLILVSVGAVVLWWRRRPEGRLGAPPARAGRPASAGLVAAVLALALLLPLFGASLVVVLLVERLLRRAEAPRRWLGLRVEGA